ncbi:MAG: DUF6057 family protein, partial [Bacteroidales bacterium]|nr:DUF6057 family protein [Bacteroidales bacterium]
MKQKTIFFATMLLVLAGVETILCIYRTHFLLLEKNTIFLYTWDFLHQHIAMPAWEEWKWTGVFAAGGLARYIDVFFAQFYKYVWAVEAVQIPLIALWCFLWHNIIVGDNSHARRISSRRYGMKIISRYRNGRSRTRNILLQAIIIFAAAAFWLYININPAFFIGVVSGALLNTAALLLFIKVKPPTRIAVAVIATPLLYFFTGIPAVLIFFIGAIINLFRAIISRNNNGNNTRRYGKMNGESRNNEQSVTVMRQSILTIAIL